MCKILSNMSSLDCAFLSAERTSTSTTCVKNSSRRTVVPHCRKTLEMHFWLNAKRSTAAWCQSLERQIAVCHRVQAADNRDCKALYLTCFSAMVICCLAAVLWDHIFSAPSICCFLRCKRVQLAINCFSAFFLCCNMRRRCSNAIIVSEASRTAVSCICQTFVQQATKLPSTSEALCLRSVVAARTICLDSNVHSFALDRISSKRVSAATFL